MSGNNDLNLIELYLMVNVLYSAQYGIAGDVGNRSNIPGENLLGARRPIDRRIRVRANQDVISG